MLRASRFGNERLLRDRCLKPYRIMPIHWLMVRRRHWRTHVVSLYWRTRHLLLRFLCLHEAVILPFVVAISWPKYHIFNAIYPFALRRLPTVELCSPCGEVPWSVAAVNRRARDSSLAMTHTVSALSVWGFAREAVYGISKCKFCENLRLITLRSRLEACEKESSIFPRRAPEASAASRDHATWGSDVELEEMESEQTGLAFSLPPSPERVRDYLFLSPRARDTISFGLDDILQTAASDSEDFGPALADALPPSGQEARPSAAYSELVDVLSRTTEKLALDWPDEPCESRASKLDERFLSGSNSKPEWRKLPFFGDLHQEISRSWKQPFSSRLTNAAAADFTNLVGSVEQGYTAMPVVEDTLASHLSPSLAPSWKSRPLLPSKPCRTTSALIGKSYIAASQEGMALHTMAILQAYQADVLKEMDEGTGLTPEAVKELHRATDLLGDTVGSLLQHTDPVPATCQSSTSLSINPNKDALRVSFRVDTDS